ncbi:hypothetical protein SCG7086_AI_00100 [Chlamydiales bacterium SCGC AG-110-P3]|nr:hypothetical protein SCG7086_AI_00100 [Chlamydiales bacterium SCGC AG-110-P3]
MLAVGTFVGGNVGKVRNSINHRKRPILCDLRVTRRGLCICWPCWLVGSSKELKFNKSDPSQQCQQATLDLPPYL